MNDAPPQRPHDPSSYPGEMPDLPAQLRHFIRAVDEELVATLLTYADLMPLSLVTMGKVALNAPGKVLSMPQGDKLDEVEINHLPRWPLFVLLSCMAALEPDRRHEWRKGLPGAVAVEIAMAAADLIDEMTDDDPSPFIAEYGPGQALNTGSLMLVMSQQVLLRAVQGSGGPPALAALERLQTMLAEAATGQHFDMLYGRLGVDEVTPEMSLRMTELKAGALISGACGIGALISGAEGRVVDLLSRFGKEIGCIAQLTNDVQDVLPTYTDQSALDAGAVSFPAPKTDLRQRKRTLPIVFALRDEAPEPNAVQRAFRGEEGIGEEEMRRAIVDAGGLHFANLIAEVHRQNALEALQALEALRPGAHAILSPLLPTDPTPEDTAPSPD